MSKSFYDFSKNHKVQQKPDQLAQKIRNISQESQQNLNDAVNFYGQMSQDDLMKNLVMEVNKQKQNGTFDAQKLENAVDSLGLFLTPQQKKNIKEIINQLK